jgi:plasmid stabilization system protein ParE
MVEIRISDSADWDYDESIRWYAERSPTAAAGFEAEVALALNKLAEDPHRFPPYDNRHRYLMVSRYPFQVIFRILDDQTVLIVAFAHASRRSDYWKPN